MQPNGGETADRAVRNRVEMVGTIESIEQRGEGARAPTFVDVAVGEGAHQERFRVAAFGVQAKAARDLGVGRRVEIDGYVAVRSVETGGKTISVASLGLNRVQLAADGLADRNRVTLQGNIGKAPFYREGTQEKKSFTGFSVAIGEKKFADVVGFDRVADHVHSELGQGDLVSVEGHLRAGKEREGLATLQIAASYVTLEHRKQQQIEIDGRLTHDPKVTPGDKATRVSFSVAENSRDADGHEVTRYRNVVGFVEPDASWIAGLRRGTLVHVLGREASREYEKDGQTHTAEYVKLDRVDVTRREPEVARQGEPSRSSAEEVDRAQDVEMAR